MNRESLEFQIIIRNTVISRLKKHYKTYIPWLVEPVLFYCTTNSKLQYSNAGLQKSNACILVSFWNRTMKKVLLFNLLLLSQLYKDYCMWWLCEHLLQISDFPRLLPVPPLPGLTFIWVMQEIFRMRKITFKGMGTGNNPYSNLRNLSFLELLFIREIEFGVQDQTTVDMWMPSHEINLKLSSVHLRHTL